MTKHIKPIQDAGTSEGAKKAAQTRKARGGGASPVNTRSNRGNIVKSYQSTPVEGLTHFPGTEGTHFAGKPLATQPKKNTANEHAQAAAYHNQKAGFPRTNKEHGEAAALHQHARMMHESPNSMIRSKANAASEKAWAASKKAK
jgi:hypothetical protein